MTNNSLTIDRIFWALGDPTRFAIIEQLASKSASVSELAKPFDMALSTFMQHLGVLESVGLVYSNKQGRIRTCALNEQKMEDIEAWLKAQRTLWDNRFDSLDDLISNRG